MSAYLPWLLILACPLMMMWMMRGMGRSGNKSAPIDNVADAVRGVQAPAPGAGPDESEARIAELEREVAELRGGRVHLDQSRRGGPAGRS